MGPNIVEMGGHRQDDSLLKRRNFGILIFDVHFYNSRCIHNSKTV
jgi:hypothetical protein